MSTVDAAYHRLLVIFYTAISLIVFMASKIFGSTVDLGYQQNQSVIPGSSARATPLTVCKEAWGKVEVYRTMVFYYSSRWHVYHKALHTGSLTVSRAPESRCVRKLYVLKSLFLNGALSVHRLLRYAMGGYDMSLVKYTPLFPHLASPWNSQHHFSACSAASAIARRLRIESVKILAKSATRREMGRGSLETVALVSLPTHSTPSPNGQKTRDFRRALVKTLGASAMKRRAIVSAATKAKEGPWTPKDIHSKPGKRLILGENLSIRNLAFAAVARKQTRAQSEVCLSR